MDRTKILGCLAALALAGCSRAPVLVVGAKNFTEQSILGEIAAQQIERHAGVRVQRSLNLGGTLLAHQALVNGEIDLYPEYSGTALTAILKLPSDSDPHGVLHRVRAEYRTRWNVEWLDPLGFNNTFAMVVRGKDARRDALESLSDAARRREGWTLGAGYEFEQRPDGLPGLLRRYPLRLNGAPKSMDLGLLRPALEQGQVDMVAANSTDGWLSQLDVLVLKDDKRYFPPYEAAFVVRGDALERYPKLRVAFKEIAGKLTDTTMRKLNYDVDGKRRPASEVAAEFLQGIAEGIKEGPAN